MTASQKTMHEALQACFSNGDITLEDVRKVFEAARELHDLETVIAASNVNYKFQADHLISCSREGALANTPAHAPITEGQYQQLVEGYLAHPVSDRLFFDTPGFVGKSILHTGIMRNGQFFGLVAFLCSKDRVWTEAEKRTLESLRMLVLFYLGMKNLTEADEKTTLYEEMADRQRMLSCYHLDFGTGQCHVVKAPAFLKKELSEWLSYDKLLDIYTTKFLDPVYGQLLLKQFSLDNLRRFFRTQEGSTSRLEFPRPLEGRTDWVRFTVEVLAYDEKGNPLRAICLAKDVTEEMQERAYLARDLKASDSNYVFIANVDLDTERYAISVDRRLEMMGIAEMDAFGIYRDAVTLIAETSLDQEAGKRYQDLFSIEGLKAAFDGGKTRVCCEIPGIFGGEEHWMRIEAVPESNYGKGHRMVVQYFSDITKRKQRDLKLKEVSMTLEAERMHSLKAELKATTDTLTGAFNRAGFNQYVDSLKDSTDSLGMILLDIDYFKDLNDNHGHAFGDDVLVKTVQLLMHAFRGHDKLFRMGGDEFILLLAQCNDDAWPSIQGKLASVHRQLHKTFSQDASVTLSAGMIISPSGYNESLFDLADKALYHTKLNGRAGLTQIDQAGNIIRAWNDVAISPDTLDKRSDYGKWRLEYSKSCTEPTKLFLDEAASMLLEVSPSLSPEQRYKLWREGISPRHLSLLHVAKDKAQATGKAECTHTWTHPSKKKLSIHSHVHFKDYGDKQEFSGYLSIICEDDVVLGHDDAQFLMQALQSVNFCSYYICLADKEYYIVQGHEDEPDVDALHKDIDKTFADFVTYFVHPDFQEQVAAFCDTSTLAGRMKGRTYLDCDYLSTTAHGWCRSRFLPVKWDSQGSLTHVLLSSASIEGAKREELERTKRHEDSMRLQLRVGEIISHTSVMQTGIIDIDTATIRMWMDGLFLSEGVVVSFDEARAWGLDNVIDAELGQFDAEFTLETIVSRLQTKGAFARTYHMKGAGTSPLKPITHHYEMMQNDSSKILLVIEDITPLESGNVPIE